MLGGGITSYLLIVWCFKWFNCPQLKEMAERLPGHTAGYNEGSIAENTSNILNQFSNESHAANGTISEAQSNSNSKDKTLRNGTKQPTGKGEWVVHDQPGVYITLSSLPGGGNELKRVRFRYLHLPLLVGTFMIYSTKLGNQSFQNQDKVVYQPSLSMFWVWPF